MVDNPVEQNDVIMWTLYIDYSFFYDTASVLYLELQQTQ